MGRANITLPIDGKTMRRSFDRTAEKSALHVVMAFAADARMTIGQVAAGDNESEITATRSLLGLLDLNGALVTGDALHCQGETACLIEDRGGDWPRDSTTSDIALNTIVPVSR